MKTDISLDALSVIMESANFNLDIGDNAKIDIGQAVDYIKSGEAEIEAAVQTKTAAFNLNAQSQITEFNTNALLQTQNFDNHIEESLNLAKQWAIGLPNEPEGNSAKYWAEQSALNLNNKQDKIPAGNAGEVVIYSGIDGTVGSATMPIVNDATLTIQKNSATVGKFTANAVDDKIINISVPTQASDIGAQEILVSGINIKTINSNSLLESGDVKSHEIITSTITNCITEIPQDIKLELIDGVLTLKAGSKVYVPNGFEADGVTPKFDVVTVDGDKNIFDITKNEKYFVMYDADKKSVTLASVNDSVSGVGAVPNVGLSSGYDTSTNIIKRYNGDLSVAFNLCSFPLAVTTWVAGSGCVSIDQVFNGFGYVGSTVFALPGVKGLAPNGRNADGSLKNTEVVCEGVSVYSTSAANTFLMYIKPNVAARFAGRDTHFEQNEKPTVSTTYATWYFPEENRFRYTDDRGVTWTDTIGYVHCLTITTTTGGVITSFNPKTAFHAIDYNDSSWVSAQAMPSGKYIDLTVGASGATYAAPANGWFYFGINANTAGAGITISWNNMVITQIAHASGNQLRRIFPVKQGDSVHIIYKDSAASILRFIYAQGEN